MKKTDAAAATPAWSSTAIYTGGMTVLENGILYRANWWTLDNDPAGNNGISGTGQPWTIVATGPTTPVPSTPTNLAATAISSSSAALSWSAASVAGGAAVTGYAVFENGKQIGTVTGTSYTVTGLSATTAYGFTVAALDSAGASAQSSALAVTTLAGVVPTAPSGLTSSNLTSTSLVLAWTAPPTPAGAALTGYTVLRNGVAIGTTTATKFTVSGLSASTGYSLTVEAGDQYGLSVPSAVLAVTTPATTVLPVVTNVAAWSATTVYTGGMTVSEGGIVYQANWWTEGNDPLSNSGAAGTGLPWTVSGKVDTTPSVPDAPTGLGVTVTSSTSASLIWAAASVPGSGTVSGYTVYENGTQVATTSATYYNAANLTASTSYQFTVSATDATGASPQSAAASVTTPAPGVITTPTAVFAPYIDMGLSADENLAAISEASGIRTFTLAFIQSSGTNTIGWAGTGTVSNDTLPDGSTILGQIQALRAVGGDVIISFGGSAGTDPAAASTSAASLQAEYQSVIDRYGVTSLDFDIEGAQVADQASITLRDKALVGLEAANPGLKISYTLPVLPTGLDGNGVNIIHNAAKDGVNISVINIMAMDYGSSVDNNGAMGTDAIDAIQATEQQITAAGLTSRIGITPMIGVNDQPQEVFSLADAQQVSNYAMTDSQVARVAMWSVARDNGATAGAHYASPDSSGIAQSTYQFSSIFEHA